MSSPYTGLTAAAAHPSFVAAAAAAAAQHHHNHQSAANGGKPASPSIDSVSHLGALGLRVCTHQWALHSLRTSHVILSR